MPPGDQARLPLAAPALPGTPRIWRCPNCGQRCFGEHPPDLCAYCSDFTTWQPVAPDEASGHDRSGDQQTTVGEA